MFRVHLRKPLIFNRVQDMRIEQRGYALGKYLQSGSYGTVYKLRRVTDDAEFALKAISKTNRHKSVSKLRRTVMYEINIMNSLLHPNILNLIDFWESRDTFNIVLEFCSGGELFDAISKSEQGLSRTDVRSIARDVLSAVRYCHEQYIIHRDIKPENILLVVPHVSGNEFPRVKLIDFGLATKFRRGIPIRNQKVGSPGYIAPEIDNNRPYNEKCDVFSVGCVIYACLSGTFVPINDKVYSVGNMLGQDNSIYDEPVWQDLTIEKQFLNTLLDTDPVYRNSADGALQHQYFEEKLSKAPMPTSRDILYKLRGLHREDQLRRVVRFLIGRKLLPGDRAPIEKWFGEKDAMGLKEAMDHIGSYFNFLTKTELSRISKALDLNQDGKIDKDEFLSTVVPNYLYDTAMRISKAFNELDTNHNKRLSFAEIQSALFGNKDETEKIWNKLGLRKDQEMNYKAYKTYLETGNWAVEEEPEEPEESKEPEETKEPDEPEEVTEKAAESDDEDSDDDDDAVGPWEGGYSCSVQ